MSWGTRTALIERQFFGEGEFDFRLGYGELVQLQDLTKAGPGFLMGRIESGASETWLQDIKSTLRLGLIGAGMAKEEAYRLAERQVQPGYLIHAATLAVKVLAASYVGVKEEAPPPSGEPQGEDASPSPTDSSGSQTSMEPPPPPE